MNFFVYIKLVGKLPKKAQEKYQNEEKKKHQYHCECNKK